MHFQLLSRRHVSTFNWLSFFSFSVRFLPINYSHGSIPLNKWICFCCLGKLTLLSGLNSEDCGYAFAGLFKTLACCPPYHKIGPWAIYNFMVLYIHPSSLSHVLSHTHTHTFWQSNLTLRSIAQKTDYLMTGTFIMWNIWKHWASINTNAYLIIFLLLSLCSLAIPMMILQ